MMSGGSGGGGGGGGGVCVRVRVRAHEPRANSVLLKVLELISQQKQVFPD